MNTEAFDILLIDLERAVRRLADIDVMNSHDRKLTRREDRLDVATMDSDDLEQCKSDIENILDVMQQLKMSAA